MDASDWRKIWVASGIGTMDDWNRVRVCAGRDLLWVISGSPAANDWLAEHLDAIAGVVRDVVREVVSLRFRERNVGVRAGVDRLWAYRFKRLVLAKGSSGDWKSHFASPLAPELIAQLTQTIETGIRRELAVWGRLPDVLDEAPSFVVVSQVGRPIIFPGVHADRSGGGRPVNVLARAHLVALSPFRLEGEFFVGKLTALGHGRLLRTDAPELLDRPTQRALLALPTFDGDLES